MKIKIITYEGKRMLGHRKGTRKDWGKLYGKLDSGVSLKANRWVVHVDYGFDINVYGKRERFTNDYDGHSLADAKKALSAFREE